MKNIWCSLSCGCCHFVKVSKKKIVLGFWVGLVGYNRICLFSFL
jgi:hypothetical protein